MPRRARPVAIREAGYDVVLLAAGRSWPLHAARREAGQAAAAPGDALPGGDHAARAAVRTLMRPMPSPRPTALQWL
jgi:hypothetical protein